MDKKKLIAGTAAVFAYIKSQEEMAAWSHLQSAGFDSKIACDSKNIIQPDNIWGISGRQELMQSNSMMQLRVFK